LASLPMWFLLWAERNAIYPPPPRMMTIGISQSGLKPVPTPSSVASGVAVLVRLGSRVGVGVLGNVGLGVGVGVTGVGVGVTVAGGVTLSSRRSPGQRR